MSFSRSARCLLNVSSMSHARPRVKCQNFHTSPSLPQRRRPRFANVKADEMGLLSNSKEVTEQGNPPIDDALFKAELAERYTPAQLQVIEEGDKAIDLEDIRKQGIIRSDPYGLPYLDDLSTIAPTIDKRFNEPSTIPVNARWLTEEERKWEVAEWWARKDKEYHEAGSKISADRTAPGRNEQELQDEEDKSMIPRIEFMKFLEESTSRTGGGNRGSSVIAPALPKMAELGDGLKKPVIDPKDPDGKYSLLRKQTGMPLDQILALKVKVLVSHNVTNQTHMGKIASVYALACAGNGHGMLGIGEGKSTEMSEALEKAKRAAIRAMKPIPRYEERTIFGEVQGKVAATVVKLMSRPPGFGLRCQERIFEMARCAGIHDLAARVPRARNKMNVVKATYEALMSQRIPDEIARGRGKKLVDVRKVYYGGDQRLPSRKYQDDGARRWKTQSSKDATVELLEV